ncbi:protein mono-ADP-ribosyltransferase PARP4 isoform X2 [Epinephelus fuscoguttatus]|uniref:protein mono-ADP-ribosyltransferase PARP4 isoform X2 n=1 Tax=Epinephelus fuscoguttatus TaxID=293821 RepID=UPI0020D084E9|nr:protein mono-ADP-ribosyltransferase PARP4 isoform X2 [Epinephelus fuscoguttatus]
MAVFENCSILLELKTLPYKEKKKLKSAITENGGHISFVVNKQCSLIVTSDVSNLSSNRLRSIQKYQTPVVGVDYVHSCVERGYLLPVDQYKLDTSSSSPSFSPPLPLFSSKPLSQQASEVPTSKAAVNKPSKGPAKPVNSVSVIQKAETPGRSGNILEKFRIYTENDSDIPTYPDNFKVAKYSIFEKANSNTWCVLELQSCKGEEGWQYRVVKYWKDDILSKAAKKDAMVFLSTSEDALEVYKALRETLQAAGLQLRIKIPPQAVDLGSTPLQQLLLEEKLNTGSLSQEVGVFVELLWTEALGCLGNILRVPINKLSLNDVSRVEGLLLQAQRKLKEADQTEVASLFDEIYTLLPHVTPHHSPPSAKLISQKLDLCQLIRDVLNVTEMTLRTPVLSSLGKYRALRCSIESVPQGTSEFQALTSLLQSSFYEVQVRQVLRVTRGVELQTFKSEVGNIKSLFHCSSPSNFVGLLSRGLLLPRVGVEYHGIERTDMGNLGSGIYFSDAMSTSLQYSKPSETDGSRLMLVCDVALGRCKDVYKRDLTLTQAPEGHDSVHGVRRTRHIKSDFQDDEYVVYSPDQVQLKYVVQFTMKNDQLKEFSPAIDTSAELLRPLKTNAQESLLEDDGIENIKNPLEDVTAGLLDSSGQQLPLQGVHVKCRLRDLLTQVIIFQHYTNLSSVPIEAKYVFPLDDSAAVCGFEAFINGKHVVGQVKEKETARKEYKQAIAKGHGAYLMDQDAPDVFTISVGNLPPAATVLIKVTYVSELIVRDGSIHFSLPGSVAPWQQNAALNQTTQVSVEKVCVTDEAREFTLDMFVEMPYEITNLQCITHKIKIKRTDCKAVVSVLPGQVLGQEGFQLSVTMSEVHLPRMWVEKSHDEDTEACMLVFYPDFKADSTSASDEVVLLLDTSESMNGEPFSMAQRIALQVLKTLSDNLRVNVIFFGTDHSDAFLTAQPLTEARKDAKSFIKSSTPLGGSTELWRPLRALSLLPPSRSTRNLLLLSDGHIQNTELTLQLLRDNVQHSRLFTCGLSSTANRHMLRILAQAGGGAYEFFDTKTKHNWTEKVVRQVKRMASPGCSSVSVKWQQFNPTAPSPVQAPKQLHALFNDCHTLVYGFVPHCTQATLHGNLSGQELKTMVSTSELQKTRGTLLHKLTARAIIRDYEDGSLDTNEAEHEGKKAELKRFIIELSKEHSILSQFTSFVAIEERDKISTEEGVMDIPNLILEEDVDFLPYISWISPEEERVLMDVHEYEDMDMSLSLNLSSYDACEPEPEPESESENDMDFGLFSPVRAEEECEDEDLGLASPTRKEGLDDDDDESASEDDDEDWSSDEGMDQYVMQGLEKKSASPQYSPTSPRSSAMVQPQQYARVIHRSMPEKLTKLMRLKDTSSVEVAECLSVQDRFDESPVKEVSQPLSPPFRASLRQGKGLDSLSVGLPIKFKSELARLSAPPPPPPPPPPHRGGVPLDSSRRLQPYIPCTLVLPPPPPTGAPPPHAPLLPSPHPLPGALRAGRSLGNLAIPRALGLSLASDIDLQSTPQLASQALGRQMALESDGLEESSSDLLDMFEGFGEEILTDSATKEVQPILFGFRPRPTSGMGEIGFGASVQSGFSFGGSLPPVQPLAQNIGAIGGPYEVTEAQQQLGFSFGSSLPQAQSLAQNIGVTGGPFGGTAAQQQSDVSSRGSLSQLLSLAEKISTTRGPFGGTAAQQSDASFGGSLPQAQVRQQTLKISGSGPIAYRAFGLNSLPETDAPPAGFYCSTEEGQGAPIPLLKKKRICTVQSIDEKTLGKRLPHGPSPVPQGVPVEILDSETSLRRLTGVRRLARSYRRMAEVPKEQEIKWKEIFEMQHSEGYWELTPELGELMNLDVDLFANVFLKSKGIQSLGVKAHADILRLVATLLVLQMMREKKLEEGKLLRTLFSLDDSTQPRPERWEAVKRAVDWVCWADRQYPCVYSRLEFGWSWESSTRQLLGYEVLPSYSPLCGLNLQRAH